MENCLPCVCGSKKLIPFIFISDKKFEIKIKCIVCNREGESKTSVKEATFAWNKINSK